MVQKHHNLKTDKVADFFFFFKKQTIKRKEKKKKKKVTLSQKTQKICSETLHWRTHVSLFSTHIHYSRSKMHMECIKYWKQVRKVQTSNERYMRRLLLTISVQPKLKGKIQRVS